LSREDLKMPLILSFGGPDAHTQAQREENNERLRSGVGPR